MYEAVKPALYLRLYRDLVLVFINVLLWSSLVFQRGVSGGCSALHCYRVTRQ